jgi:hypothetical protein
MAANALAMTNNMEEALNLLINDPESCLTFEPALSEKSTVKYTSPSKKEVGNVNDLFEDHSKALTNEKKIKTIPSTFGFMVMLACYLRERMPTLND